MLFLQVALESLGNLVGGGSGASKSSLVRAGLMNGTTEENDRGKEGVVLGHVYPFVSYFPFPQRFGLYSFTVVSIDLCPSFLVRA